MVRRGDDTGVRRPAGRRSRPGRRLPSPSDLAGGQRIEDLVVRPWPQQRARRTRWIVVGFLVLAPLIATALTWWGVAAQRTTTVVEPLGRQEGAQLNVLASAQGINVARNEMTFRLVFQPVGALSEDNRLTEPVTVIVNDVSGNAVLDFDEGTTMGSTLVVVPLSGSQLLRYPFDEYRAELTVGAVGSEDGADRQLALDLSLDVALDDFGVTADATRQLNAATVSLEMARRGSVIIWVLFFMVLVWAIALACASTTWFIVVFANEPPFWVYALLAAILFALPTLRAGLPGSPPYGSLVDWASFYWGVAIVAVALVSLLVVWNVEARVRVREAAARDARTGEHPRVRR
jgi:hypothetical protein